MFLSTKGSRSLLFCIRPLLDCIRSLLFCIRSLLDCIRSLLVCVASVKCSCRQRGQGAYSSTSNLCTEDTNGLPCEFICHTAESKCVFALRSQTHKNREIHIRGFTYALAPASTTTHTHGPSLALSHMHTYVIRSGWWRGGRRASPAQIWRILSMSLPSRLCLYVCMYACTYACVCV